MAKHRPFLVVLGMMSAAAAAGCVGGAAADPNVAQSTFAVGEPTNGFPSPAERLGLMAINRARSDPQTVSGPMSMTYPPRPPVIYSYPLSRSSRFHATNLQLTGVTLMHTSPCTLKTDIATTGCAGDPACGCAAAVPAMCASCAKVDAVNTCGTETFARIGYFTAGNGVQAGSEVAAAGYANPIATVNGWMFEAQGSDGHRQILTDQGSSSNAMGYGRVAGTGCYSSFDVSDSGKVTGAQIPKLPTAAVSPSSGAAGTFTFYATWADPALGAPSSLNVVIDGTCTPMVRELGTDNLNATYKVAATLAAGCHSYFVAATDAAGAALTYPTTGALTVSVAGAACSSEYLSQAPAASCAGGGAGGAPAGGGGSGSGGSGGAGAGGSTGGGSGGAGAPADASTGVVEAGALPGDSVSGGCGCGLVTGAHAGGPSFAVIFLSAALLLMRRKRRGR